MSIFDEELTIEKLKELGFKSVLSTQYEYLGDNVLYKDIKNEYLLYRPEITILYFTKRIEDNIDTIFKGIYGTTHFYDTVNDVIEMTTLIHRAKEMLKENIDNLYQFSNKYMDLT